MKRNISLAVVCTMLLLTGACWSATGSGPGGLDTGAQQDAGGDVGDDAADTSPPPVDADDIGVDASPVECGSMTCDADQYCMVQKCCGADPGFNDAGEWQGSDSYRCVDVPAGCDPTKPCECDADLCGTQMPQCEGRTYICPAI